MSKQPISFDDFLLAAGIEHSDFINKLHSYLHEKNCTWKIREAANGYVISYVHKPTKRTVANFLFRKKRPMLRVYADNTPSYADFMTQLPSSMKRAIREGGNCSRLVDPSACNSRCLKGFDLF